MSEAKRQESPQQAIEKIVGSVLDEVFKDYAIPQTVRRKAHQFSRDFAYANATYLGPEARRAAGVEYDAWADEIFQSIQQGDHREDLITNFIVHLGRLIEEARSDALFALVIEEITDGRRFVRYQLTERVSNIIHGKHWSNYAKKINRQKERPFFRALLENDHEEGGIGVWFGGSIPDVYPYSGEFDDLLQACRSGEDRYSEPLDAFWLSAIRLESDEADQPHRLIFIVYPNHGTPAAPKVGRAASQEWRMLRLLRMAYRQVDHKIRNLDKRMAAQRSDMIRDLGPGFLAHELHTHLANLHDLHYLMADHVNEMVEMADHVNEMVEKRPDDLLVQQTSGRLLQAMDETIRIFQVVKGYNNLMRARALENFTLFEVIDEVLALTRNRVREYARAKVLIERNRMTGVELETDHGLLLVVLTNIIVNATQAIQEQRPPLGSTPPPDGGDRIAILMESEPGDKRIQLLIANSGPPVTPELRQRIFKRGYTTRLSGHGQGLYLCRQILSYLEGTIEYADPEENGLCPGAGFMIEFARQKTPPKRKKSDEQKTAH